MPTPLDAIVVGAGPAGASAALVLARAGRRVALVDRATFPRDKACGDLIGTYAMRALRDLGIERRLVDEVKSLRGAVLYSPNRTTITGDATNDARVIPRFIFDHAIVSAAREAGAIFVHGQVQRAVRSAAGIVGVEFNDGTQLRAPVTIGADGWSSRIAAAIGTPSRRDRDAGIAVRSYFRGVYWAQGRMHFFVLPPGDGYAWIFPMRNRLANVGLGFVRGEAGSDRLHEAFERFVGGKSSPGYALLRETEEVGPRDTWPLAFGWRDNVALSADGALLAGDAASLVSPLSGSGIHTALVSGMSAAQTALAALAAGDVSRAMLRRHDARLRRTLAPRLRAERWLHDTVGNPRRFDPVAGVLARIPGAGALLAPFLLNLG